MNFADYERHDATGLADLVRTGAVSAAELLDTAIARAEAVNPRINAIVRPLHDYARGVARAPVAGPFAGVPFLIKDLFADFAGEPTTSGSRYFRDFVPKEDSELVRRFKAAGLVIFGKTNTPELGLTPFTEPTLFGPARNPWNLSRTTGGSSGGAGAAVAAGIVPMASGGDGGGSIRIPASANGLVGLKPTRGRIPTGPVRGNCWHGAATEHVLTRSVRDTAAMLDATGGPDPGPPHIAPPPAMPFARAIEQAPRRLRIAFSGTPMCARTMHPECLAGLQATAKLLANLGHEVIEDAPKISSEAFRHAFMTMVASETAADYAQGAMLTGRRPTLADVEPRTMAMIRLGRAITGEELGVALRTLDAMTREIGRWFERYDVLLQPTLGMPPFPIGALQPDATESFQMWLGNHLPLGFLAKKPEMMLPLGEKIFEWIPNTAVFNVTGQPSLSLPLHWSADSLPVGMMFTARFAEDATLLQLAAQLEKAKPWFELRPPI